ncbi:hypothetical protein WA026_021150 [Henosepilachna vigintioctopunctata]|uniref:Uncharacterized protein n=1 Tax=Henosepilachna vigintioctopunctata TaxID=420089 RepID=A0AAW1U590_9CUCU
MSYEKEQAKLDKLWQDIMPASEDDFSPDISEYNPSDFESSDEGNAYTPKKKRNFSQNENLPNSVPVTSVSIRVLTAEDFQTSGNINEIIEQVIASNLDYEAEPIEENSGNTFTWSDLIGKYLRSFPFTARNVGISTNLLKQLPQKQLCLACFF